MAGAAGEEGYYINNTYGPFKSKEIAEFFNFIAFGSPRSLNAAEEAKAGVQFLRKPPKALHPNMMFRRCSPFSVWWEDTFGCFLTNEIIMDLAKECKANGYKSFIDWLIQGSKINGKAPHHQYSPAFAQFS